MFKKLSLSKLIMLAVTVACLLSPMALAAMPLEPVQSSDSKTESPPSRDPFPMYSSYNYSNSGPSNCPLPAIFKHGTRTVYSYASIVAKEDYAQAVAWYELDDQGKLVSKKPLAVSNRRGKAGDLLPFGGLSFKKNGSGNVGVYLFANTGSGWFVLAGGAYRIAAQGESAPQPGPCPLD